MTLFDVSSELLHFLLSLLRSRAALSAENLFLRKQLAFYQERQIEPRRLNDMARICLVLWSRLFHWREALVVVKPATLIGWHRRTFRLFWRWKSRGGRPRLPKDIRHLIAEMVRENPTWGQAQVAAELALKLGVYVSPRTVRAYWPQEPLRSGPRAASSGRWKTFIRNHAKSVLACDFFVAVSVRFQLLYVLVVMEIGTRRIVHCNVTTHPTAAWTMQQMREAIPSDHAYRFLIHDRDTVFSVELDKQINALGMRVLRTPVRAPQANAYCERLVGTIRRECLDYLIPLNARHLRHLLREFAEHFNRGRPHSALGPGIPDPAGTTFFPPRGHGHSLPTNARFHKKSVLGGLHHEYRLDRIAA
ncbi:MAG: integrase core domain-containing protein [Candidatus Korobacteraceae bacterium]